MMQAKAGTGRTSAGGPPVIHRRLAWLVLLSVVMAFAGSLVQAFDLPAHRPASASSSSCPGMDMATAPTPARDTQHRPGRHSPCGVDCPMHCCGAPATWAVPAVACPADRLVLLPAGPARADGWQPTTEHGPPRPDA